MKKKKIKDTVLVEAKTYILSTPSFVRRGAGYEYPKLLVSDMIDDIDLLTSNVETHFAEYKKDSTVNVIETSLINNVLWGRTTSGWIILDRE